MPRAAQWLHPAERNGCFGVLRMLAVALTLLGAGTSSQAMERLRVLVETDIGGDADDQASFVRFLLYANEWDVEGIIADRHASAIQKDGARDHKGLRIKDGWELAQAYLDAYRAVYPNLKKHAEGYPEPERLKRLTAPGWNETDAGVTLIIAAADRNDPRPIWYGNWGSNSGSTSNLRRAFDKVKAERSPEAYRKFVAKFRIVTLDGPGRTRQGHEEAIALHVETGYPELGGRWYHRFRPLTEKAGGFNVRRDVQAGHGPLGALYTTPKEGDSCTFIYLIPTGLSDPSEPTWGGWAGRYGPRAGDAQRRSGPQGPQFYWANQLDTVDGQKNRDNTLRRWAEQMQNDFRARLDWCVAEQFEDANHPPLPHVQGDSRREALRLTSPAGKPLALSAAGTTDPDGDALAYRWFVYPEPGTYEGRAVLREAENATATLDVPADASGKTIHVVLQATDDGEPKLTRYRRVVVEGR